MDEGSFYFYFERKDNMMEYKQLADLLLPDITLTRGDMFKKYPRRNLCEGARVTRFAPSPTGMLHVGGVYAALVYERIAHQSKGVCYLRIEDTDRKREISSSIPDILNSLNYFGINFDEGPVINGGEIGTYGPYKQSQREEIYKVFIKELIEEGIAYPCFCTADELDEIRKQQMELGELPGYHGIWAKHREITYEEAKNEILKGKQFVIRLKSPGSSENKVRFRDLIKGEIEMPENIQDIVILKSDGLPTYHFAHAIDDYLMGTTNVFRGDEWLSSTPVHIQLFNLLKFKCPEYAHISPIMKFDGNSKRKFSKRKDADGIAEFYKKQGYPGLAVVEYFMSLINSNYEDWRGKNPDEVYTNFMIDIEKMSVSGALLDVNKLNDTSKNIISRYSGEEVYSYVYKWAEAYDNDFFKLISSYKEYSINIFNIGRTAIKPRKDIAMWSEIKPTFLYFFDELFYKSIAGSYDIPASFTLETVRGIIVSYLEVFDYNDYKDIWFDKIKGIAEEFGYAKDMKAYRKNPEQYLGHVGDVAMVIRIALANRTNTPDLYDMIQVMGRSRVIERFEKFINCFEMGSSN